jgi:hypothetical protein
MHDLAEAIEIYNEEKSKNPDYDTVVVNEWKDDMPEQFTMYHLKKRYGCHIVDTSMYQKGVNLFEWVDEKGTGAKWAVSDIKNVSGINFSSKEYTLLDYAYILNMLYSDNCNVDSLKTNDYLIMAKNYLEDPDYMGDASERAYYDILKRIRYFE